MGIRGLTSYVAARQDECATEVEDLTNVTLGVDLDSFLHFACRELVHTIDAHWLLLGGDARALYVWVRAWMRPLFERKIRLKFVRDPPGMLNTIKDVARGRRRSEKMEKSKSVVQGLYAPPTPLSPQGIDEVSPLAPTVPLDLVQLTEEAATTLMETQAVFAFARKALVTCLQHAGCSIVTAPIEADETLGELVRSKTIFAAVAHDSDYLIMHKVRYIPFSSIQVDPTSGFVRATVFDSDKLAAVSGLAPEKLVEWAIVCGNDFTPYVDMHFNLAKALHLPALRQSQGSYDVADALVWLQEHLGTSNWLDDPEFKELLTHDNDLLTHVYGIYCFYGVGGAVKKRFPTAVRHAVLSTVEWKRARKLLDKAMLPSFAIDVMFDQRRSLSHRWMFGDLTWCPLLAAARQGTYGLLRQTNVEEYVTCVLTGNLITRLVTATPSDVGLDTKHAKSIRADHFQAMVLSWVAVASTVHTALATWKPPKKQVELKFVGYALGMVLAASDTLSYNTWTTLLLTSVVSICIQKESSPSIAFVPPAGLSREVVETACRYLSSLEALFHVCDILKLHTDVNCHAFYSASLFAYFLKTSLVSKTTVQRMVAALTEEQVQACMWSFHTLVDLFAKALPPTTASSSLSPSMELQTDINGSVEGTRDLLTPAVILLKNPTMAKKGAKKFVKKASRSTVAFPTEKLRKPTAINATDSDGNLHPFEWAVDVSQTPTENVAPAPKDLKQLIFSLPVFKHKEEILDHVATNPLVVIQGETGCGKSTSVPQFLLDANAETANIYVTQPRRVAALTLAATVARMRGETVGATIGYRVGQMQHDSDKTQITYVTTGYMLERLIHNPDSVKGVTHLILDEAHERSMDMDMLLLMVATNWRLFPALKLVIMSATMDASIFFKYFKPVRLLFISLHSDELFVGSALHPVKTVFLEDMKRIPGLKVGKLAEALNSWDKSMMNDVEMARGSGCILIFVSGLADIQYLHEKFESWPMIQLFVLHSDIEMDDQAKAFKDVQGKMKIILSTNIAESSVTIPDVTHIVNTALEKQILMDKTTKSEVLVRMWCSKASVKQRSGVYNGRDPCDSMVTHEGVRFMETCMDEYTTPELLRKPLDKVVLQMKAQMQHIGTPSELLAQAVTPPDVANIDMAYKMLHTFSAVTSPREEDSITSFGLFSVHFPLDIRLCRLLMYGLTAWEWGVGVVDVVLLVAVLASPDLHLAPSRFHIASSDMYMHEMKAVLAVR
ncbi:hypothetical protein DYB32_004842 [Aphanomyces invadans]|uniref:Helicase ATP-binding domain-containing protein n=1 Tax=Aphanomyces invadans TaxID=157072 RepID=A0A3R6VLU0_9STRA|nr:hypothetical protein DYB32_004842 [Aphanomyces invadans]